MNNLRCFDETDVRTSQKTTYAQFKIYRTSFIDEIGPRTGICLFRQCSLGSMKFDENLGLSVIQGKRENNI